METDVVKLLAKAIHRAIAAALLCPMLFGAPAGAQDPVRTMDDSGKRSDRSLLGDRSHEMVDYDCRNEIGRRQITLFGNGTVRLREGLTDDLQMTLGELTTEEVGEYLDRIEEEDLTEVAVDLSGLSAGGEWVERCTLKLALPALERREISFGRYDSLPLALSRVVAAVEDLASHTLPSVGGGLPSGYEPKIGDVLRRVDGVLFQVVGFTGDGQGVELQGVEQPLTIYIRPGDLRSRFADLVERRAW